LKFNDDVYDFNVFINDMNTLTKYHNFRLNVNYKSKLIIYFYFCFKYENTKIDRIYLDYNDKFIKIDIIDKYFNWVI